MTIQYGTGSRAGIAQAPHPAGRVASAQALPVRGQAGRVASAQAVPVRRPASGTTAALPADPFARRPWLSGLSGLGGRRLSGRPAVFVLASLIVALLASSAAPTPLYAIY